MSIVCLQDRDGNFHIKDYKCANSYYITFCGSLLYKISILNTFDLDYKTDFLCKKCLSYYEKFDYDKDFRHNKSLGQSNMLHKVEYNMEYRDDVELMFTNGPTIRIGRSVRALNKRHKHVKF